MADDAQTQSAADARLAAMQATDEVIGLSAEVDELRTQVATALERATAAASIAQGAVQTADRAAGRIGEVAEYLAAVTEGFGAPAEATRTEAAPSPDLDAMSREELIERIRGLEAVLSRRSVRAALGITQKLRGS